MIRAEHPGRRPPGVSSRLRSGLRLALLRDPREFLSIAAEALWRYKLRTALSILGVVLGVAAVIAMMSVSDGARRESLREVQLLGLNNLVVRNTGAVARPSARSPGLTAGDADSLLALIPLTQAVSPLVDRFVPLSHAGKASLTRALGVTASYQAILHLRLARGRFLSSVDERGAARVCVLGAPLARDLFEYHEPIGETIRLDGKYFTVIGVLADQAAEAHPLNALAWRDLNDAVLVPLPALSGRSLDIVPGQRVDEIWLQASDGERVEDIGRILDQTVTRLHRGVRDAEIVVPRELLAQRYQTQRTFSIVVGSVAALSLIVGGIGIMNVMLTSVMERTNEIGVRRAVGATRRDVAIQFLTESLFMTLSGGVLGIALGAGVSWGIAGYAGWKTLVSMQAILLACGVSFATGLVFGLYPATTAARLAPVEALHYE